MPPTTQRAKASLAELLAQQNGSQHNQSYNGQTGAASRGRNDETLSNNVRKSRASSGDEDDDGDGPSAGGAFAVLAALSGAAEDDDEWIGVSAKPKKKAPAPASAAHGQPRRPAVPPAHAAAIPSKPFSPPSGAVRAIPRSSTGQPRAPYIVPQAPSPRPQTHDLEGKPVSDTYYQTFQKAYRNSSGAVCIRFHKTDVVMVRPNGDIVLSSGGFRTRTTFLSVQEALEPLQFTLIRSMGGDDRGDWVVVAPDGSRTPWEDGMVLPASSAEDRGRGQRLMAAYGGGSAMTLPPVAAAMSSALPRKHVPAPAPPAPVPAPARMPAPPPASTWSYRSTVGGPPVYAPHLRSPGVFTSTAGPSTSSAAPAPVPVPTPRTAESLTELQHVLNAALAIQDDAAGRAQNHSGGGGGPVAGGPSSVAFHGVDVSSTDLDDEHACIACMEALKTTLLIPCGHMVMCGPCAEQVLELSGECPMCRSAVVTTMTVSQ